MKGWVYVISTKTHNLVKVGYTERDPKTRAKELDGTSAPHPHVVEYVLMVENPLQLEQAVHGNLGTFREGKEWFSCTVIEAVTAIRDIAGDSFFHEDAPYELAEELERQREAARQEAAEALRREQQFKVDEHNRHLQFNEDTRHLTKYRETVISSYDEDIKKIKVASTALFDDLYRLLNTLLVTTILFVCTAFYFYSSDKNALITALVLSFLVAIFLTSHSNKKKTKIKCKELLKKRDESLASLDTKFNIVIEDIWRGQQVMPRLIHASDGMQKPGGASNNDQKLESDADDSSKIGCGAIALIIVFPPLLFLGIREKHPIFFWLIVILYVLFLLVVSA